MSRLGVPAIAIAGLGMIVSCAAPRVTPTTAGRVEFALAAAPLVAPITYFEESCASCHGPHGMFYGENFGRQLDDAALRRVVHEMVVGPARSKLDPASLESLMAYHRALAERQKPFLVVTSVHGSEIRGEVWPQADVVVRVDVHEVACQSRDAQWTCSLPADWKLARQVVVIARNPTTHATSEVDLSTSCWSHATAAQVTP